jgi:hypothetical protein
MALAFSTVARREVKPVEMAAHADSRSISRRDLDFVSSVRVLMGDPVDSVMRCCTWLLRHRYCRSNCRRPDSKLNLGQRIAVGHHQRRCDQHTDCEIHLMAGCSGNPAPLAAREAHGLASKHLHGLLDPKPD